MLRPLKIDKLAPYLLFSTLALNLFGTFLVLFFANSEYKSILRIYRVDGSDLSILSIISTLWLIFLLISALRKDSIAELRFYKTGRFTFFSRGGAFFIAIFVGSFLLASGCLMVSLLAGFDYVSYYSKYSGVPLEKVVHFISWATLILLKTSNSFSVLVFLYGFFVVSRKRYSCSKCEYRIRLFEKVPPSGSHCPCCVGRFYDVITYQEHGSNPNSTIC